MQPDSSQSRLTQQQQQQTAGETVQSAATGTEYANVEELLRADRAQTPPPPAVEQRVRQSLAAEPASPPRSWWSRWWRRRG
jgi:hypothetical protein